MSAPPRSRGCRRDDMPARDVAQRALAGVVAEMPRNSNRPTLGKTRPRLSVGFRPLPQPTPYSCRGKRAKSLAVIRHRPRRRLEPSWRAPPRLAL
jgi:hypothetical protein